MLHGAGIFTNMCPKNHPNLVGKYIPYMEHMGDELAAVFYDQRVGIRYKIGSWTSTKKGQKMSEGATNLYVSMIICLKRDLDV